MTQDAFARPVSRSAAGPGFAGVCSLRLGSKREADRNRRWRTTAPRGNENLSGKALGSATGVAVGAHSGILVAEGVAAFVRPSDPHPASPRAASETNKVAVTGDVRKPVILRSPGGPAASSLLTTATRKNRISASRERSRTPGAAASPFPATPPRRCRLASARVVRAALAAPLWERRTRRASTPSPRQGHRTLRR